MEQKQKVTKKSKKSWKMEASFQKRKKNPAV